MKYILLALSLMLSIDVFADMDIEKMMSKITRDTKNYISAEARASTEEEAYEKAIKEIADKVTLYYETELKGEPIPDAVYLDQLKNVYQKLTTHGNRYRVMLYIKKQDLRPMATDNVILMSKTDSGSYDVINTQPMADVVVKDTVTVVEVVEKPQHPVVSTLLMQKTKEQLTSRLKELRQDDLISGAAAFPMSNFNDYYIAVINSDNSLCTILHVVNGKCIDMNDNTEVDPLRFKYNTGYWFTIK